MYISDQISMMKVRSHNMRNQMPLTVVQPIQRQKEKKNNV